MRYRNRIEAGARLAEAIVESEALDPLIRPLVLGVPRGGIPVAAVVADRLGGELDVLVAHKLGAPGNPEYAIGAVAEDGTTIVDEAVIDRIGVDDEYLKAEIRRRLGEVERQARTLRGGDAAIPVADRVCVVVDDGVATGSTLEASLRLVARCGAARTVAAVPVGPPDTIRRLGAITDAVVCPLQPSAFFSVGAWYDDFRQVSEQAVIERMGRTSAGPHPDPA